MNYIINKNIYFNSLKGSLNSTNNSVIMVQLSKPGARLLAELIIHSGEIMTRENLIKKVWEDHNLTPSGSNLSNHISLLRKAFLQLDVTEHIIITVPKVGFRLEAEVDIHCQVHRPSSFLISKVKDLLWQWKIKS